MSNIRISLLLQGLKTRLPENFENHSCQDIQSPLGSYLNNFAKQFEFSIGSPIHSINNTKKLSEQIDPLIQEKERKVVPKETTV